MDYDRKLCCSEGAVRRIYEINQCLEVRFEKIDKNYDALLSETR